MPYGGRVTPAATLIGTMLSIKPLLTIQEEKLDSYAKSRGSMKKAEEKMILAIQSDLKKDFPIRVCGNCISELPVPVQ